MKKIVVLISGSGSNLEAILESCAAKKINGRVIHVISNNPDAYGLTRAAKFNIPSTIIDHKKFSSRIDFENSLEVEKYVTQNFEESVDGVTLLQEYIESNPKVITRLEFVKGKFLYAVQVDASDGFELCPADLCNTEEKFCPTNPDGNKFMIIKDYKNNEIKKYENLLKTSKDIFQIGFEKLSDKPFSSFWEMVKQIPSLLKLKSYLTVSQLVNSKLKNEYLRKAFSIHPLLVGGNPFTTTSIYALIHYLERKWGVFFCMGGTGKLYLN